MDNMDKDDHGSCKNCGYDLNGRRVYDCFLEKYDGDKVRASETAAMYGCKEGHGRFGKAIYVKSYTEHGKLREWICPECKEECY